jgi:hypothetical protein
MSVQLLTLNNFIVEHPHLITWGGVGLLILLSMFLQRTKIKEGIAEYRLNQLLKKIGLDSRHNLVIPDGIDGNIFVEHLILMPNEIFLLGVKKFKGFIFAAEQIDLWTQVVGNKSYKFENPLHLLESNVVWLNSKIEKSKIGKKVLFIKGCEFPKGKPENIVSIDDVKMWRRENLDTNVAVDVQKDWDSLVALELNDDVDSEPNIFSDGSGWLGGNLFSILSTLVVIGIWLFWRFMQ